MLGDTPSQLVAAFGPRMMEVDLVPEGSSTIERLQWEFVVAVAPGSSVEGEITGSISAAQCPTGPMVRSWGGAGCSS